MGSHSASVEFDFAYGRLSKDEVRLVKVRKNPNRQEKIEVRLITTEWPPPMAYEALSYVWGDPAIQSTILISEGDAALRPCSALDRLSYAGRDRVLWVDALCIDQNNVEEKVVQVANMGRIFQGVHSVCV
ncbi:hypothetical protein N658DRAFT_428244 [Parathielavia hyrcaniae]|uniref:Heterokaryon incompatibility domain-containing protein n=1 Tax=Parathielavia hyrcaniae TaxID=113614 RepID=A0AAN6Q394_9PEZI|nr:hypothetical protein N658DRAFT_428244 [Parathielavia hyrcaniae]